MLNKKKDVQDTYADEQGKPCKLAGKMDYVSCWYFKAAHFMQGTNIRTAFVSTNSITQGEQTATVWKPLCQRLDTHIDFAYRSFIWDSESNSKAHVHCVIIGFSCDEHAALQEKKIFFDSGIYIAQNINPYLVNSPTIFVESRDRALCSVSPMVYGNKPTEGGFLLLSSEERKELLRKQPNAEKFIRRIYGAAEYINNKERYCLWLKNATPSELRLSGIKERVEGVRQFRLASPKAATQRDAATPWLFQEDRQPDCEYIIVPRVSSERREYIPIGFVMPDVVVTDAVQIIPNATLAHFGVLTSSVHMTWMRTVAGRLKSDYRYSKDIVYNNFPWPMFVGNLPANPPDPKKPFNNAHIAKLAQTVLDARAAHPNDSLAALYDPNTTPADLRKAHKRLDDAVLKLYGLPTKATETEILQKLFGMYDALTR